MTVEKKKIFQEKKKRFFREDPLDKRSPLRILEEELNKEEFQILLGSLLGDGSLKIHKNYKNARFSMRHSLAQEEYFNWKVESLKRLASTQSVWLQKPSRGEFSSHGKLRFQTRALPSLTALYRWTHKRATGSRVRIWRSWLNRLGPLGLAIWWLDDGSLISQGKKGVFCTDGFSAKDLKVLKQYMKKVWDIDLRVKRVRKNGEEIRKKNGELAQRMYFKSSLDLQKFLKLILKEIPVKSMLYKCALLYKNSELQQRWISIMSSHSKFSEEEILTLIEERKNSLKYFSKKKDGE